MTDSPVDKTPSALSRVMGVAGLVVAEVSVEAIAVHAGWLQKGLVLAMLGLTPIVASGPADAATGSGITTQTETVQVAGGANDGGGAPPLQLKPQKAPVAKKPDATSPKEKAESKPPELGTPPPVKDGSKGHQETDKPTPPAPVTKGLAAEPSGDPGIAPEPEGTVAPAPAPVAKKTAEKLDVPSQMAGHRLVEAGWQYVVRRPVDDQVEVFHGPFEITNEIFLECPPSGTCRVTADDDAGVYQVDPSPKSGLDVFVENPLETWRIRWFTDHTSGITYLQGINEVVPVPGERLHVYSGDEGSWKYVGRRGNFSQDRLIRQSLWDGDDVNLLCEGVKCTLYSFQLNLDVHHTTKGIKRKSKEHSYFVQTFPFANTATGYIVWRDIDPDTSGRMTLFAEAVTDELAVPAAPVPAPQVVAAPQYAADEKPGRWRYQPRPRGR